MSRAGGLLLFPALCLVLRTAAADTVVKVGLISSYSGFVAQAADQAQKGLDLYIKEHGNELPPGVRIELLRRDDTSNPEVGKRLAQELIGREHVQLLTGVILSPCAAAIAPLTAEAKVPLLISIAAGGAQIPRISPYVARVTFTLWQQGYPIGKWAAEQGWKKGYTAVSDFIPGHDSEASFTKGFTRQRHDHWRGAHPAAEPRFRAVHAAHSRRQARRRVPVDPDNPGYRSDEGGTLARAARCRHPTDLGARSVAARAADGDRRR
jgi:ABC-type branched-subunit amino acid transport system substrate-binding protein